MVIDDDESVETPEPQPQHAQQAEPPRSPTERLVSGDAYMLVYRRKGFSSGPAGAPVSSAIGLSHCPAAAAAGGRACCRPFVYCPSP